jgi:hypothetical protein
MVVLWGLFSAVERTTSLEIEAVQARDFPTMETLYEAKKADLARLFAVARRLGVTRQNAEFQQRLLALERLCAQLAEVAGLEVQALRSEWQGADLENQRLRSLKRAYVSDKSNPDFHAEG